MARKPKANKDFAALVTQWVGSAYSVAVHTVIFLGCFAAVGWGLVALDTMLLGLTTVVSLEAIYLALFIQMSVNQASKSLEEVEEDIDEIQEDIDEIQEDVDEIQEDVEEIVDEQPRRPDENGAAEVSGEKTLNEIRTSLQKLLTDIEKLQNRQ